MLLKVNSNGILVINKEQGYTSRDVVNKVGKLLNTKKVGHTGTLDPMATGVLVLALGNALKTIEFINHDTKEYIATAKIGLLTDTLDITGNIIKKVDSFSIDKDNLNNILKSFSNIKYIQEVPLYSSIKVNGERLYRYARENKEVILPKREVYIYNLEVLDILNDSFTFKCTVSKGTYIRSLIRDIGDKLGIPCTMEKLNRIREGIFSIEESYTLKDIEENNYNIIPIERIFPDNLKVIVDSSLEKQISNGKILDNNYDKDKIVFINNDREVLAIYETYIKDTSKIKPIKVFKSIEK